MNAPAFVIEDFTPETVNEFTDAAAALAKAHEAKIAAGETKVLASLTVEVPAGQTKDGDIGTGQHSRLKFQKAANDLGYTARVRSEKLNEETETIAFTFTLGPINAKAGRVKSEDEVESEVAA